MKVNLLTISIIMSLSAQSFALTKNIDFYTNSSDNTNRFTVSGFLSEIDNISFNNNSLLIEGLNASSYITLNDKSPYILSFNEQDLDLYEIINQNKGKKISIDGNEYKVVGLTGEFIILTNNDNEKYIFKKIDKSIEIPKEWFMQGQKGLKASFDNPIKESDKIYYSQEEDGLTYTNDYQAVLQDNYKINLIHYITINNKTNKTFDNVNVSVFLSEANVIKTRPALMYKAMSAISGDSLIEKEQPQFNSNDIAGLKTISLSKPITIQPNVNKIKHTDKLYTYKNYVNIYLDNNFKIYFATDDNSDNYEAIYKKSVSNLRESLINNKNLFTDMIEIQIDKDDILASGNIDIYEKNKDNSKLIVSTNLIHNENENLNIEKSKNRDLAVVDVKTPDWDEYKISKTDIKNGNFDLKIKYLAIKNNGKNDYNLILKGKEYTIKSGETVNVTVN